MLNFFFFQVFGDYSTFSWMQKYGIQLFETKYSPLSTSHEMSLTSVSYFFPQVSIYWIAFAFWLFNQNLLILFLQKSKPQLVIWTNWQCLYWLTESQRDVCVLHLILIFPFPWHLKWKEINAKYNIPWNINKC